MTRQPLMIVDRAQAVLRAPLLQRVHNPVALGDYCAGPNHVLPTAHTARFASPLGVYDFMTFSSHLSYSKEALQNVLGDLQVLTNLEGLDAHGQSGEIRLKD